MKKTPFFFIVLFPLWVQAQTDPPLVASGALTTDLYQWDFSIGDLSILTFQNTDHYWTQGSQQPTQIIVSVLQPSFLASSVEVYPNPAADFVFCKLTLGASEEMFNAEIFDVAGKSLPLYLPPFMQNAITRFSLASVPSGQYFLRLTDAQGTSIVKSIQKN